MPKHSRRMRKHSKKTKKVRKQKGGGCPAGWSETSAVENAVIKQQTGKDFHGTVTFISRHTNKPVTVRIARNSSTLGSWCTDKLADLEDLCSNYSGFIRKNPDAVTWTTVTKQFTDNSGRELRF